MADGKVVYEVDVDNSKVDGKIQETENSIEKSASGWGSKAAGIAGKVGTALVGATTAAGAAVIHYGMDFETAFSGASTLIDTQSTDMEALKSNVLDLSDKTGIAASDLSNTMYNALSAGVKLGEDGSDMMMFLESSAKLAKSGFTDVDTAVTTTAKVLNAYKMDVSETDKVHKILMQTQNNGITTVGELGSCLANVTPTASAMGVSFEQVGASLATMTAQGTPAAQATTQLNSMFAELGKSGTQAQKALEEATESTEYAGMSFQDMANAGVPLNEILGIMKDYAEGNGKSLLDMFGSLEAGKAALAMTGENAQQFTDNLVAMGTQTDVVGEAFDKVSVTTDENLNRVLTQLQNIAIQLFDAMAPIINELLPVLGELLAQLLPPFAELVETLMPMITEALNLLMPPLMDLISAIMPVIVSLFEQLLPPIIQLIGTILPPLLDLVGALLPIFQAVIDLLAPILELICGLLGPIINLISSALSPIIEVISSLINLALKPLMDILGVVAGVITQVFGAAFEALKPILDNVQTIFGGLIDFFTGVFTGNWEQAWDGIVSIFKGIFNLIPSIIEGIINGAIGIINGLIWGINQLTGAIGIPAIPSIPDVSLPRFKQGIDFVPGDFFPAYLDYGERVLTQEENAKYTALGGLQGMQTLEAMISAGMGGAKNALPTVYLEVPLQVDGREIARATAKYTGKQLSWEDY